MKKIILFLLLAGVMPSILMAQNDDLYFKPKKKAAKTDRTVAENHDNRAYYSGSNRDVDEYNRRGKFWSHYQKIGTDEQGNDIIEFKKGNGVYPDSSYIDTTFVGKYYDTVIDDNDYRYTARMSRWDGFYDPWFYRYSWHYPYAYHWGYPWYGYAGWYDPWYYSYGWYDPWYYGYAWSRPYYGWYGWGYPHYGGVYVSYNRPTGYTHNSWGGGVGGGSIQRPTVFGGRSNSGFGRYAGAGSNAYGSENRAFGGRRNNSNNSSKANTRPYDTNSNRYNSPSHSYDNRSFGGRSGNTPSYSSPSSAGSRGFGGGSFSGSPAGGRVGGASGGMRGGRR